VCFERPARHEEWLGKKQFQPQDGWLGIVSVCLFFSSLKDLSRRIDLENVYQFCFILLEYEY
jgi:hypothetical protein